MRSERSNVPKRRSFTQGFAFGSATFAVNALVSLISAVATARLYGVTVIGQYALAYAPVGTVWYLSSIQEQPALVRKLSVLEPRVPRVTALWVTVASFSQGLTTLVVLIAAPVSVVALQGPLHHPGLVAPALTMLAGYLLLGNPGWNIDTLFASFRAARELLAVRFHQMVMFVVPAVALRLVTTSVWGLVAALLCSYGTSLVHRIFFARRFLTFPVSRAEMRGGIEALPQIVRFGLKVAPGAIASGMSSLAGTWILGALAPVKVVGAWSRASNVSQRLNDMNNRTVDMLLPTLVERQAKGDMTGFYRAMVDSMRYVAVILLLPAAVAGGAAKGVLTLLFGSSYAGASGALVALALVPVILGVNAFGSQALLALNRPLTTTALEGARMAITVGAGIALTAADGSTGMGIAAVLGCAVEAGVVLTIMARQLESPIHRLWPPRSMMALGAAYAAGFAVAHLGVSVLPGTIGTLVGAVAGSAAYVCCILGLGGVLSRDRQRLRAIIAARRTVEPRTVPTAGGT